MPTTEPRTIPPPASPSDRASKGKAAWSESDLTDPHAHADKPERVRRMFGAIARSYDLNNRLHSLWRDQAWRRFAVRQAAPEPNDVALDVACGTGDLTMAMLRGGAGRAMGLDFTPEMLDIARHKLHRLEPELRERIEYIQGDAMALPLADASVDVVSIAFGIRNVADPARAIKEFRRVLRPGGRLVILEFGTPRLAPVRWFNEFYCRRLMPITATLISGDRSGAYRYLPRSIETFLTREQMVSLLERSGLRAVTATDLTLGICTCYRGIAHERGSESNAG
jgi:demethylmenaquinone methyltransferase/2-methoxy-6-polyprenyl-1,4-benzoquinol methylase